MAAKPRELAVKTPPHLKSVEKSMWRVLLEEHEFNDEASLALLRTALESHQRARLCREAIDRDGQTFKDRFGQVRIHPLLATERDARAAFIIAMKSLNLDIIGAQK